MGRSSVWTSCSWLPILPRSIGFDIGPLRILEARDNGEGVRQAYFAPIFARKRIHANASKILLSDTKFELTPLTIGQTPARVR
jgi:hypothetical protein